MPVHHGRLQELQDLLNEPSEHDVLDDAFRELSTEFDASVDGRAIDEQALDQLEALDDVRGGTDVFFTARVLDALPDPLAWTGLTPRMRAATLLAFHFAAGVVAVLVFRWASPQSLHTLFETTASWFDGSTTGSGLAVAGNTSGNMGDGWSAGLSGLGLGPGGEGVLPVAVAVSVVAVVALWASRSHSRAA